MLPRGAELLILGTGAHIAPVSPAVQQALRDQGIGLEVADTVIMLTPTNLGPICVLGSMCRGSHCVSS